MKNFKMWHLAVIALAVFLILGGIVSAVVITKSYDNEGSRWNLMWNGKESWSENINFGKGTEHTIDETDSISSLGISLIEIDAVSAEINIVESSGSMIEANLYGSYYSTTSKIELEVKQVAQTVKITVKYSSLGNINATNLNLDIMIPADYAKDIKIDTVSSPITFDCAGINFIKADINNVSGTITTDTLHAEKVLVNTVSGRIQGVASFDELTVDGVSGNVSLSEVKGSVRVNTISGNVSLNIDVLGEIEVDSTSGDVEIVLSNNDEFYVEFSSVSGDFSCDRPITIVKQKDNDFEGYVGNEDATRIMVDSVSGDLTIN